MPENWKTYKLGDVLQIKNGKTKPKDEGHYPIYGGNGILGYGNESNLNEEAILIGRVGAYCGAVYYENREIWVSDNSLFGIAKIGFNTKYLYYLLKWANLNRFATGSSQPLLTQGALNVLEYEIPISLPEQLSIASILSALDDKIELNLQMNKTLEEMAMTLYKHWFVDFGPFQDGEFVDSELGMIPKGWEVSSFDSMLVLQRGFDLPEINRINGIYPVFAASGRSTYHCEKKVNGPGVTTGRSGVLGKVFLINEDFWPLNTTLWVKEYPNSSPYHAYFLLSNIDLKEFNSGSAVPTLNRNDVHRQRLVKPPLEIITKFDNEVKNMFDLQFSNYTENQSLTILRNTLLPKLISGEIRVKDVEKTLATVFPINTGTK